MLEHDYVTNMKRKLDQLQESDGQILLDHQRFVGFSKGIYCLRLLGLYRIMKLQMINLRYLLLLGFCPVLRLRMITLQC
ncbi:hypothetical protein ACFX2A_041363 [Malus domestica]